VEELRDAPPGGHEAGRIVGADDAAARREDEGLEDARIRDVPRRRLRIGVEGQEPEPWYGHAPVAERHSHRVLVRGAAGRGRRVVREPELLRRQRGDHRGRVARRDDAPDRTPARSLRDLLGRASGPPVVEREEIALLSEHVLDPVAPIAPHHERHAEPPRRRAEVVEPIARGRDEEQQLAAGAGHGRGCYAQAPGRTQAAWRAPAR
jgi:hypothetical protein